MEKIWDFFRNHRIIANLLMMIGVAIILFIGLNIWLRSYTRHDDLTSLPSVKYLSVEEAVEVLTRHNLRYEIIDSVYIDNADPGIIIEQIPAPETKVKEDRTIYLTINAYSPKTVKVPNIINASIRQGEAQLKSVGFRNIIVEYKESPYKDLVLDVKCDGHSIQSNEKVPTVATITMVVGQGHVEESDSTATDEVLIVDDLL